VAGYLFVLKPTLPPFEQVCETCRLAEISRQDNGLFYWNNCKVINACVFDRELERLYSLAWQINRHDRAIDMIMKSEWIEAIVGMNKETLLKLLHENRIQLIQKLLDINTHSSFSLSPIRDLIGYAKLQQDKNSLVCKELVKKLDWQYYRISQYSFSNFEFTDLQLIWFSILFFTLQISNFKL